LFGEQKERTGQQGDSIKSRIEISKVNSSEKKMSNFNMSILIYVGIYSK
jgi:hypothetical protein